MRWRRSQRKRSREAKKKVGLVEAKDGSSEEEERENDGGLGSSQERELSSASGGRKGPRPQRVKTESWIGMWRKGVEDCERQLLARKEDSDG